MIAAAWLPCQLWQPRSHIAAAAASPHHHIILLLIKNIIKNITILLLAEPRLLAQPLLPLLLLLLLLPTLLLLLLPTPDVPSMRVQSLSSRTAAVLMARRTFSAYCATSLRQTCRRRHSSSSHSSSNSSRSTKAPATHVVLATAETQAASRSSHPKAAAVDKSHGCLHALLGACWQAN